MNDLSDFSLDLSVFDLMIVFVLGLSTVMSLRRGFAKEALSLGSWVLAFLVARHFHDVMNQGLETQIQDGLIRSIFAFIALFVGTLLVGATISYLLSALINATGLSSTDRVLGMVFGFARGALIVTVLIALVGLTPLVDDVWYRNAKLVPHFEVVAQWALKQLSVSVTSPPTS